jgi:hypothetical protein
MRAAGIEHIDELDRPLRRRLKVVPKRKQQEIIIIIIIIQNHPAYKGDVLKGGENSVILWHLRLLGHDRFLLRFPQEKKRIGTAWLTPTPAPLLRRWHP